MKRTLLYLILAAVLSPFLAGAYNVTVRRDTEFYDALCSPNVTGIHLTTDVALYEDHWPQGVQAPCVLQCNKTVTGRDPSRPDHFPTLNFNFIARKIRIPPFMELRLDHLKADNVRRGNGGDIDFVAYSPNAIVWTIDVNKHMLSCVVGDPAKIVILPLPPPGLFPEFINDTQSVQLLPNWCQEGRCWQNVLWYETYATFVNYGTDSETGGYILAKRRAVKTCDQIVNDTCTQASDACVMQVINAYLAKLPAIERAEENGGDSGGDDGGVNALVIALPAALGGAVLVVLIAGVLLYVRRRRRWRGAEAAAAAAKLAGADVEAGSSREKAAKGDALGAGGGAAGAMINSSGSDITGSKEQCSADDAALGKGSGERENSFEYDSRHDMGRELARDPPTAVVVLEGTCEDGSACAIDIGPPLGQGSFGIVFRGVWKGQMVAVKVILCERTQHGQVAAEVRFMTSFRHPNVLRAYACCLKTRVINPTTLAAQALEATLTAFSSRQQRSNGAGGSGGMMAVTGPREFAETWIISEYCNLGALSAHVYAKRFFVAGRLQMAPVLRCLHDMASGMAYLHHHLVVHGDLKLANVLLTATGPPPTAPPSLASHQQQQGTSNAAASNAASNAMTSSLSASTSVAVSGMGSSTGDGGSSAAAISCSAPVSGASCWGGAAAPTPLLAAAGFGSSPAVPGQPPAAAAGAAAGCGLAPVMESPFVMGPAAAACMGSVNSAMAGCGPASPLPSEALTHPSLVDSLPFDSIVAKVADFGLSKALKEGQTHHSTKTVGTVTHMPPELLRSGKMSPAGDVYSFGIIMWEFAAGCVPYRGLMYGEVVERVVVSHRRPDWPPYTPGPYRALAERCWAADAALRPPFEEVVRELEGLMAACQLLQGEVDAAPPMVMAPSSGMPSEAAGNMVAGSGGGPPTSGGGGAAWTLRSSGGGAGAGSVATAAGGDGGSFVSEVLLPMPPPALSAAGARGVKAERQ